MKVFVIGDSISMQYGPYLQAYLRGWMDYARKMGDGDDAQTNLDQPQGANGGDSSMVLAFVKQALASGEIDADLLLINCGLHDIKTDPATGRRQVPLESYRDNLRSIVDLCRSVKPQLIWIRTTPCDEAVHNTAPIEFHRYAADCDAYNAAADQIMADAAVPTIDLHGFTQNLGDDLYCDHVHFHDHVQQKQGAFIAGWLAGFVQAGSANPTVG